MHWCPKAMDHIYLQKHLPKNAICFFPKYGREYDCNTILRGLHEYRFFVAIVDLHQIALSTIRCLKFLLMFKGELEGSGTCVTFQKSYGFDECFTLLCCVLVIGETNKDRMLTSFCGDLFEVDFKTDVVLWLSLSFYERTIFAFQDVICT